MPELRPYQLEAVDCVLNGVSYLAFDAGLGKTAIAITVAKRIRAKRILVVCPATVRLVWEKEIAKWWTDSPASHVVDGKLPPLDAAIFIINYDKLSARKGAVDYLSEIKQYAAKNKIDLLVLDEAHALKNPKSNRSIAVFEELLPYAERVLAMSGTPAPNHAGELYAPIRALAPEIIARPNGALMSQLGFENRYCEIKEKYIGAGRTVRQIVGSQNVTELKELLRAFMLRKTKAEVLSELPPLQFVETPVTLSSQSIELMSKYDCQFRPDMTDDELLAAFRGSDEHIARLRTLIGISKVESCGDFILSELLDSGRKAVVWADHHAVIDALMRKLGALGPVKIDGRDDLRARGIAVQRFLESPDHRIFVGNIKAASTGLTLVSERFPCSDAYFVEASFTPGDNYQSACRIHRHGQRDSVLAKMFVVPGTIDERVMAILTRKTNDLAELFGNGGANTNG